MHKKTANIKSKLQDLKWLVLKWVRTFHRIQFTSIVNLNEVDVTHLFYTSTFTRLFNYLALKVNEPMRERASSGIPIFICEGI